MVGYDPDNPALASANGAVEGMCNRVQGKTVPYDTILTILLTFLQNVVKKG